MTTDDETSPKDDGGETERVRAALESSERRFRTIFEGALDGILLVEPDSSTIVRANRAAEHLLGHDHGALVGRPFASLFPPDQGEPEDVRAHDTVIASQAFLLVDGSTAAMDVTATIAPWDEGSVIVVTIRDVSERRRAERAREALIRELDAFAHTVAHDLRNPLTIVTSGADLLEASRDRLSDEDRERILGQIGRGARKMAQIIDELLLLAGVRDRQVPLERVEMGPVLVEARSRIVPEIEQLGAEIAEPAEWPTAVGYAPWVEEVWTNYLSNALRYGGRPPWIEVGATVEGPDFVRYWVRDNGKGIAPEDCERLFTPFTQLEERASRGHGLGLSIVQRIVERLGGTARVESELGVGSTFSFSLPTAFPDRRPSER